ncbi:methionine-R-sulfoxide reductase B3 isoform X3 [Manacus candei]|uniref:methionine-R-sulfoxide reductase B3 isoform X3 n=1 Tax=Manacus candei TaxID=415023 RepID=UPI0022272D53|nr:methionine-R-sulfoxide reductase B3 isoform X3 [Manacus candei]
MRGRRGGGGRQGGGAAPGGQSCPSQAWARRRPPGGAASLGPGRGRCGPPAGGGRSERGLVVRPGRRGRAGSEGSAGLRLPARRPPASRPSALEGFAQVFAQLRCYARRLLPLFFASGFVGSCRDKKDCKVVFSQEELRKRLTPLQYHVTQEKGTESAFEGEYTHHKAQGIYKCVVCGTPLFKSETKFDSNSGWPSFYDVISPDAITFNDDFSYGMHRIEISCSQSDCEPGSSSVISITSFQLSLRSAIDLQGRGSLVKQHDFPVQDKYFSSARFYFFISCGRL